MSPPRLDGSRAKVQRAKEHFQDLIAEASAFRNLNPYGVARDDNLDTGEQVWRARVSRSIPPELTLIVGDVIHNLRAALDFAAWQLEIANGRTPSRTTQFPIWNRGAADPTTIAAIREHQARRERQLRAFGEPAMALIERLQPDSRGDPKWTLHPLWLLHQLDVWDKHKLLVVVGAAIVNARTTIGGPGEDVHIDRLSLGSPEMTIIPLADGAELMRLTLGVETPNVQVKDQFSMFIAFAQDEPGQGEQVVPTCDRLIRFVDEALSRFAALP